MATLGEIRFQLSKTHPGVDHDLLDAWILDGYQHILAELDWQRLDAKASMAIPAEYNTGTVAVTAGSPTITGTGTTWATEMTGRLFRLTTDGPYYQFTWNSTTTATLDRPYEGTTATGAAYRINQNVFRLPGDCRFVQGVDGLTKAGEVLPKNRTDYGAPVLWMPAMDSYTDPPLVQIEVYPVPVVASSLVVAYTFEDAAATLDTTVSVLPWAQPAAIKAYVSAQAALSIDKNIALHQACMGQLAAFIAQMRKVECQGRPAMDLRPPVAHHRLNRRLPMSRGRR